MVFAVMALASSVSAQIQNGDFEANPPTGWMIDGPNVPRVAQGDGPVVRPERPGGNNYAFLGDRNMQGRNGENPSRIFQRFDCPDLKPDSITMVVCKVEFRFRSALGRGETAWVRVDRRVYVIPNT